MSEKITSMMRAVSIVDFPFNLELNGNSDEPAGKIVVNKGEVTFFGNFDKAAQIFVEHIAKRWSQQWKKHEKSATEYDRFMEVVEVAHKALEKGTPLDLESLFKGELASAMFATMFAGEFVRHGAKNYLELTYNVPKLGEFTVTIQRKEGKTPGERIAELERSETQLINERDSAESALNDAYKAVMGQAPEWSNWFSFENAIDEIELVCELWRNQTDDVIQFRQRIQELEAKLETADRLQDGAFRDGLKAGFSYGQTDDQSGFTQCMSAYNTTPASLLPDGLIRAVHFYEQVKRENPPVETGAWKDAIDWVLKEACLAASTLESSREHEAISQQEKA